MLAGAMREGRGERPAWPAVLAWLVALGALARLPPLLDGDAGKFYIELLSKVMIMAIFALSLQLLIGYTGLVSLGHAAYFAAAAYATAMLAPQSGGQRLAVDGCGDGRRGHAGVARRHAGAAHARHLLHHGHAGLRPDGLFRLPRHQAGRRQRWHLYLLPARIRPARRPGLECRWGGRLLWLVLAALAATVAMLAQLLRSRFGHAGRHPPQRAAHAGGRLCKLPLPARRLRRRRHAGRAGRLPLRHPVRLRESGDRLTAPVWQRHADGHPGRRRQPRRRGAGRLLLRAAGRVVQRPDPALAVADGRLHHPPWRCCRAGW